MWATCFNILVIEKWAMIFKENRIYSVQMFGISLSYVYLFTRRLFWTYADISTLAMIYALMQNGCYKEYFYPSIFKYICYSKLPSKNCNWNTFHCPFDACLFSGDMKLMIPKVAVIKWKYFFCMQEENYIVT